uniref:Tantalus domain-containing protein n=1 Tax=Schistosoma mansoni TaxID=6183 RepID=A0A3Q0KQ43_SCHMA
MSNSKRRRSDVEFLELRNIIESPPTDLDADQNIRKSKRLRRDSICLSNSENKEPSKPSRAPKRKSSRCPLKQLNSHDSTSTNHTQLTVPMKNDLLPMDISSINTVSFGNLSISSPNKSENTKLSRPSSSLIPAFVSDFYLSKRYVPPKHRGLATVIEDSVKRSQRRPRSYKKTELSPIRRQIFTGQTLEEACAPTAVGIAPLDSELVLSVTRKRVIRRQKLAKKLGFRGISISKQTEENFAKFLSQSNLNSSHSSSASV